MSAAPHFTHSPVEIGFSAEAMLPSMVEVRPGAVLIPFEERERVNGTPTIADLLLLAKMDLEARGVDCELSMHTTSPTFQHVADGTLEGKYVKDRPGQTFALFTLSGVGEPQEEILRGLVQPGSVYAGEDIPWGSTIYHSRAFRNNPGLWPDAPKYAAYTPDTADLIDLLTRFTDRLGGGERRRWQSLLIELDKLTEGLRTLKGTKGTAYDEIRIQNQAINTKNAEIRDLLGNSGRGERRLGLAGHLAATVRSIIL